MLYSIDIIGARTHNLKNISCSFDHGRLTVVTGVSGSGKSSLAFDTLYAEGQRRYVESLSTYARQFIERMERPDVDAVHGVQPAIALEQKNAVRSARSTVGTSTETYDYLRLLFAKIGRLICTQCARAVVPETPDSAMKALEQLEEGTRLLILGPLDLTGGELEEGLRAELVRQGFHRLWDGAGMIDLESGDVPADPNASLAVLTDRLAARVDNRARLRTALEQAFKAGRGQALVVAPDLNQTFRFSTGMVCDQCGTSYPRPEPHLFSFYSPLGACTACEGFGRIVDLDLDKIIPNRELCIDQNAIAPWNSDANLEMYDKLRTQTTAAQIPRLIAISQFSEEQFKNLVKGVGRFGGIKGFFKWLEDRRYKVQARVMLARYRAYRPCTRCKGTRLRPEALAVQVGGLNIAQLSAMPVRLLRPWVSALQLNAAEHEIGLRALETLQARLDYLDEVGLGYLTLDRQTRTLSGGESQRINLATALGSALTDTLYVLDEPTVGLHARDTDRLIRIMLALRDLGNTVVVVEHDLDVMRAADKLIDMGPGAGELGGEILFDGPLETLAALDSPTAAHLRGYHDAIANHGRKPKGWVTVEGASGNNLRNVTAKFPLGVFCCVTGVSGSGKTTLVRDTLCAHFRRVRDVAAVEAEPCAAIHGLEQVESLSWVDQTALAGSSRSNPVTYVKAYEAIRKLLAETREAKAMGLTPRDFSFNVEGGRCEVCQGTGTQTIDMHFMANIEVVCEACDGKRFQQRVLQLQFKGVNIDGILSMTVDHASAFFAGNKKIIAALEPLREVGLGYLRLGQSTTTLSGGEAQRLKLAGHLTTMRGDGRGKVFVFDEPTTGLHPQDLVRLLAIFQAMVERGCTLIVIEHNPDLIAAADWIIDLGPEGGDLGGRIIAEGPPAKIIKAKESLTGIYLARRFDPVLA